MSLAEMELRRRECPNVARYELGISLRRAAVEARRRRYLHETGREDDPVPVPFLIALRARERELWAILGYQEPPPEFYGRRAGGRRG
jgi:hypothetical protein